jgi:hypothetical protein
MLGAHIYKLRVEKEGAFGWLNSFIAKGIENEKRR